MVVSSLTRVPLSSTPTSPQSATRRHFHPSIPLSQQRTLRSLVLILCLAFVIWNLLITTGSGPSPVILQEVTKQSPILHSSPTTPYERPLPQFATWTEDLVQWVDDDTEQPSSFLQGLTTYTTEGHSQIELSQMVGSIDVAPAITAILSEGSLLQQQMHDIRIQSLAVQSIVLVCKSQACFQQQYDTFVKVPIRVILVDQPGTEYPKGSAGEAAWMQVLHTIQSDWIWIIDPHVRIGSHYLEYVYSLMQTTVYKDALLGSLATLLPANLNHDKSKHVLCLPEAFEVVPAITQPVDMIQGAWLLPQSWTRHFNDHRRHALSVPVPFYISQSLSKAGIPSIVLPPHPDQDYRLVPPKESCKSIQNAYFRDSSWKHWLNLHTSPTALDQRQFNYLQREDKNTLMAIVDGPEQAIALQPLLCRFDYRIHVAVTGAHRGLGGDTFQQVLTRSQCRNKELVMVHDLDITVSDGISAAPVIAMNVLRLAKVIKPNVFIHIRQESPVFHIVDTLLQNQNIVTLGLPVNEVHHCLWLADLPIDALQYWSKIDIDIVIITDRRPHSLSRLLQSIDDAYYLGDSANLKIHLEQSSDRVTRMLVNGFRWRHGKKTVRHRIQKGGLMPAIIESWYPTSNHNYAVLLEDDIEVSPLFYVWTKYNILRYRYSPKEKQAATHMFGISLYSPRHLELLPQGRVRFDPVDAIGPGYAERTPYLCQVPCSWGAVYFPEHWREFHRYLTGRLEDIQLGQAINITVPDSRSNKWRKSWKKYFIELVYLRGYVMLYPNFQGFESFSTNHLEMGTHVTAGKLALKHFLVPLMEQDTLLEQLPHQRLPAYSDLPVLDLWGQLKNTEELDAIGADWHNQVTACPRTVGQFDPRDLLCPFPDNARRAQKKATHAKKQPTRIKLESAVEHVKYVFQYTDTPVEVHDNDFPEAIDVSQLKSLEVDHSHDDDELLDLEQDVETLQQLHATLQGQES